MTNRATKYFFCTILIFKCNWNLSSFKLFLTNSMNTVFEKKRKEGLLSIEERSYFRFKACSYSRELTITAKLLLIENIKFYCDVWDFVAVPKFTGWGSKQCYVEEKEVSLVRNNNIRDGMSYNTNKWAKQFSKWKVIPYYKEKQNLLNIARYYGKHLQ